MGLADTVKRNISTMTLAAVATAISLTGCYTQIATYSGEGYRPKPKPAVHVDIGISVRSGPYSRVPYLGFGHSPFGTFWDWDGDGIPNEYDARPFHYDWWPETWVGYGGYGPGHSWVPWHSWHHPSRWWWDYPSQYGGHYGGHVWWQWRDNYNVPDYSKPIRIDNIQRESGIRRADPNKDSRNNRQGTARTAPVPQPRTREGTTRDSGRSRSGESRQGDVRQSSPPTPRTREGTSQQRQPSNDRSKKNGDGANRSSGAKRGETPKRNN